MMAAPKPMCRACGDEPVLADAPPRGPYARLGEKCRERRRREQSAAAKAAWADKTDRGERIGRGYTNDEQGAESFEAKAKALVSYGKRVDRTLATVRRAEVERADARALLREALEGWKAACLRLAGAGERGS